MAAYYDLIPTWEEDLTLCGSETILAAQPTPDDPDAGPTLTALAVREGLVDEVSLLVHSVLAGTGRSFVDELDAAVELRLVASEERAAGLVWLRYSVVP